MERCFVVDPLGKFADNHRHNFSGMLHSSSLYWPFTCCWAVPYCDWTEVDQRDGPGWNRYPKDSFEGHKCEKPRGAAAEAKTGGESWVNGWGAACKLANFIKTGDLSRWTIRLYRPSGALWNANTNTFTIWSSHMISREHTCAKFGLGI